MATVAALLQFEKSLCGLLAQLEAPRADAQDLALAVERNREAFVELSRSSTGSDVEAELVRHRCRGTVALLAQIAQVELRDTERRLRLAREARRALSAQTDAVDNHGSCDYAG